MQKAVVTTHTETFRSNGKNDGWVLESAENSDRGDTTNDKATTIVLGDDKQNRQYRSILDFPTDSLPDNAVITKAMLLLKGEGVAGANPFLPIRTSWSISTPARSAMSVRSLTGGCNP